MTPNTQSTYLPRYRVADFCGLQPAVDHLLPLDSDDPEVTVTLLRKYADMPFIFLISADQVSFAVEVLRRLKTIRSTCYPYALFVAGTAVPSLDTDAAALDVIPIESRDLASVHQRIKDYAQSRFTFDPQRLKFQNTASLPSSVDVFIVGAGITGLYAAQRVKEKGLSFCVVDKREVIGGIWSQYANTASQVNSSECAYRLVERAARSNRDHSMTREILEDMVELAEASRDQLFLNTTAEAIRKRDPGYEASLVRDGQKHLISAKGVILAINDRVGDPRDIHWENETQFKGRIMNGFSDETLGLDWRGKRVVVVGMGAFAIENARTALEAGAQHVTVICRRHGTVCPKIIDYLNFATPYDENFKHANKSNMRNMLLWKNLYKRSGATEPECWMGKIKHTGHTISVSDIWFIGHYLKKLKTVKGAISGMYDRGVIVDGQQRIEADVVINCVGFLRNAPLVQSLCGHSETYNINYLDKDFMYLADAYIDDDAFNSFFGSSVLEMDKFYLDVFLRFFDSPDFDSMIQLEGIYKIPVEERAWSHYIAGAEALIGRYPEIRRAAWQQVEQRTQNFLEAHDLTTYIAANKREWVDTHSALAGRPLGEEECLPYVFEKLLEEK